MSYQILQNRVAAVLVLVSCFAFAFPVLAAPDPTSFDSGLKSVGTLSDSNGLAKKSTALEIMQSIVKWLLSLIGTIAVISLLYGGFLYITSQGEENQAEKAKNIILYSIIGIIIIGLSAIIVNVVISLTQL